MTQYSRYEWNNLYNTDFLPAARRLPAEAIDTTIYHPPTLPDLDDSKWNRRKALDQIVWNRDCVSQVDRLTKPNGTVWIIGNPETLMMAGNVFVEKGWRVINFVRCYRPHITKPRDLKHWDRKRAFTICWMAKSKHWHWDAEYVHTQFSWSQKNNWIVYELRPDEIKFGTHPDQLSDMFVSQMVKSTTPTDGAVLDPFCGTGTVAVVCERSLLKYVGFETDPEVYRTALARVSEVKFGMLGGNRR